MTNREELAKKFWDRSKELTLKSKKYQNFLQKFWHFLLECDIGKGDITTNSIIPKNKKIFAKIISKEDGILAGSEEIIFLSKDLDIKALKKDGSRVKKGDILLEIKGDARKILTRERAMLNLLQRMSGIATLTGSLVEKMPSKTAFFQSSVKIAATRKTLWGLMDKKAVSVGSGLTHRLNLSDGMLIKDNHLNLLKHDIKKFLELAKNKSKYVEIEVENKEQALKAARALNYIYKKNVYKKNFLVLGERGYMSSPRMSQKFFFAIMLDKVKSDEIKRIIAELKNKNLYDYILFEASGNITPDNLAGYKNCGVDIVSMGWLTNSAKALDISMEVYIL